LGDLETPETIRNLQQELYRKAKNDTKFRFYSLYDKVYRDDILGHAYQLVQANGGAAGVDGVTCESLSESKGVAELLAKLKEELKAKTYRPKAVRRVYIPKPDGGQRPLGIPCIRDRVVQSAAKLVLEPIFEADFTSNAYAYRPERGAHDAIKLSHSLLRDGYTSVVDADLSKYFDTIPHRELMRSVGRRVSDGAMLKLIKMWLEAPVEEGAEEGPRRMTGSGGQGIGTPQGGVISPLLANIYMRRFLLAWESWGLPRRLEAHVINYADDFVILCRNRAADALEVARDILQRMKLTVNEEKTRLVDALRGSFDFLGYTFGPCYAVESGRVYLGAKPSRKRIQRIVQAVGEFLDRHQQRSPKEVMSRVNSRLLGWANYYSYGTLSRAYGIVDRAVAIKVRAWFCKKYRQEGVGTRRFPDQELWGVHKLVRLQTLLAARRPQAPGEARPRAGCGRSARPVR
jgi:RNA-directed DNA polymerase